MTREVKIEHSWKSKLTEEFSKEYMRDLSKFLKDEKAKSKSIYPPSKFMFRAFDLTKSALTIEEKMELNRRMGKIVIGGKTFGQRIMEIYSRPETQAFIKEKGTVYGTVQSPVKTELDKIRKKYGKAAYSSMQIESLNDPSGIAQREALGTMKQAAKAEGKLQEAEQLRKQLDELYNRARRGY